MSTALSDTLPRGSRIQRVRADHCPAIWDFAYGEVYEHYNATNFCELYTTKPDVYHAAVVERQSIDGLDLYDNFVKLYDERCDDVAAALYRRHGGAEELRRHGGCAVAALRRRRR